MPFKIKKTVSSLAPSGNSVQFSGNSLNGNYATSKYLYTPVTTSFDPGTNTPWTIEFWVYPITACAILTISTSTNWGNSLWISWASSFFNWGQGNSAGSNPINVNTAASYPANNWYHVSICKDSSYTSRMFINGTEVLSSTYNSSLGSPNRLIVNGQWDNAGYSYGGNCYVSNVRWIKGTGIYTASFTVPTAPLTAIANTQLLICNGPTIVDSSTNNFAITNNNAATVSSTVTPFTAPQSVFKIKKNNANPTMLTGYGASFDGTNNIQTPSNAAFGFGTGDWTIEGWFRASTSTAMKLWKFSDNSDNLDFDLGFSTFGGLGYYNGSSSTYSSAGIITSSIWYHIAAVRKSGTASVYLNGVSVLSQTSTTNSSARSLNVGSAAGSTFNGYISNFRVLKGTALYSASFVPPTSPITSNTSCSLLTCNAATIIDGSSNAFTLTNNGNTVIPSSSFTPFSSSLIAPTNYSVAFNGTNQYLTVANSSALQLNTGNFTIEGWIYATAFQASSAGNDLATVCDKDGIQGSTYSSYSIRCTNSGGVIKLKADCNTSSGGGSTGAVTSTTTINTGTWYHFAYVRNGATAYLYINGTQEASAGIVDFYTTTNPVYIGYGNNSVSRFYWPGYISNVRLVKGTALYTASFTPSTTPLTAITNTQLLTCNSATIVDNSSNNFAITNNNTATVSSTITPFSASVSNSGFKLKQVSYVRPNYMIATGGDLITTSGSYKIHTFTTVGTSSFVVSSAGISPTVECLLVGGGGGAGYWGGAGGGAGGVVYTASFTVSASSYNVVVGIGGSGSVQSNSNGINGNNTLFGSLTALGGGGGGSANNPGASAGNSGGSGGGGGSWGGVTSAGGAGLQPASTSGGYGNNGGTSNGSSPYGAGGGGGAGGVGGNAAGSQTGNGGVGITNALLNSALVGQLYSGSYYVGGGGGAGGSSQGSARGAGGVGGGANGSPYGSGSGSNGVANTGGGGGGGQNDPTPAIGGSGGSGVVIIKYRYTT